MEKKACVHNASLQNITHKNFDLQSVSVSKFWPTLDKFSVFMLEEQLSTDSEVN